MGYTMVTIEGERVTAWVRMAYGASGAFEPQWPKAGSFLGRGPSVPFPACPHSTEVEYYDHRVDPGETVNLAASPNATIAARLEGLLARLRAGWRAARKSVTV